MKVPVEKFVEKPWGSETWIAVNEHYALKIIRLLKGHRTSLQYHNVKEEHIYLGEGKLSVEEDDGQVELCTVIYEAGEIMHNAPLAKHRLTALEDSVFVEVSTPHLEDVIRVEDDYHRLSNG